MGCNGAVLEIWQAAERPKLTYAAMKAHESKREPEAALGAAPGSETWTCRMCNGHGGHAEGCPGESEHIQLLAALESSLSEYPKIPSEVWIGTDSAVDKVRWLARRCDGSDRTISRLHDEKMELLTLLRSLHEWFMEKSPENYNGCGLWIDVDAMLRESPNIVLGCTTSEVNSSK